MKRRNICFFIILSLFFTMVLMSSTVQADGTTLVVDAHWSTYIDPAIGSDDSSSIALINLYDSLVYPGEEGAIEPHVAESWEISDDLLTYTFNLKDGIKFESGNELTAEDVKFSMERMITIGRGYGYLFEGVVDEVEVIDDYTAKFHLNNVHGPFLSSLIRLYILDKEKVMENLNDGNYGEYQDYGTEFLQTNSAGSGAYKVKEFPFEEYVLFEKNSNYWGEINSNAPDFVRFMSSPDPSTVNAMVQRGEIDISNPWLPSEIYDSLGELENIEISSVPNGKSWYLMLHYQKAPTDCIYFRRALSYLIDYEEVQEGILPGQLRAQGPVSSILPGFKERLPQYEFDIEKAKEALAKSKYYNNLDEHPVTFTINADTEETNRLGLLLQARANEIGIDVELNTMSWSGMVEAVADKEETPNVMPINVAPHYAEAGSILEARYHSSNTGTWEQTNWLESSVFDQLIDDALSTADQEERFEKYGVVQELAISLSLDVFLTEIVERRAYDPQKIYNPRFNNPVSVSGYNLEFRLMEYTPDE